MSDGVIVPGAALKAFVTFYDAVTIGDKTFAPCQNASYRRYIVGHANSRAMKEAADLARQALEREGSGPCEHPG